TIGGSHRSTAAVSRSGGAPRRGEAGPTRVRGHDVNEGPGTGPPRGPRRPAADRADEADRGAWLARDPVRSVLPEPQPDELRRVPVSEAMSRMDRLKPSCNGLTVNLINLPEKNVSRTPHLENYQAIQVGLGRTRILKNVGGVYCSSTDI